jgi:hypothetical protein
LLALGQVTFEKETDNDKGKGAAVTEKSSTAKSLPSKLVLLLYNLILTQEPFGLKVKTTCCQPFAVGGAVKLPETSVTELAFKISTPIIAGVGVPDTGP